ncbi:MAG TPA: hypothetical protein ENK07_01805 [Bacteroidetes bacterium]|nr:hypothetical protein [Bacteroidota bacterium]
MDWLGGPEQLEVSRFARLYNETSLLNVDQFSHKVKRFRGWPLSDFPLLAALVWFRLLIANVWKEIGGLDGDGGDRQRASARDVCWVVQRAATGGVGAFLAVFCELSGL